MVDVQRKFTRILVPRHPGTRVRPELHSVLMKRHYERAVVRCRGRETLTDGIKTLVHNAKLTDI